MVGVSNENFTRELRSGSKTSNQPSVLSCLSTLAQASTVAGKSIGNAHCLPPAGPFMRDNRNQLFQVGPSLYRFSQAAHVHKPYSVSHNQNAMSDPSMRLPLSDRTNLVPPEPSSENVIIQSLLRENQQMKTELDQYKNETQAKLTENEGTIRELKESVSTFQKKALEMKLQKEVYIARESHAFQEIQQVVHGLLQKTAIVAPTESEEQSSPVEAFPMTEHVWDSGTDCNNACVDIICKLKLLGERILALEGMNKNALTKRAEVNLESHMEATNNKLDLLISRMGGTAKDINLQQTESLEDMNGDTSPSTEHLDSDDYLERNSPHRPLPETPREDGILYEVPTLPVQVVLENSEGISGRVKSHKKRKLTRSEKRLKKRLMKQQARRLERVKRRINLDVDDKHFDEKPPVLRLPCRISRRCRSASEEVMPVLYPEVEGYERPVQLQDIKPVLKKEPRSVEYRRDDALIGIKRENNCNEIHGKDFSKIGFYCLCGAKFTGAGGLYVHQVKAMEHEKFSCRSCGKKFHYFSGLKAHRKSAHKQEITQEVGCSRCGQVFKSKKERQGHVDIRGQTCWLSGSYQSKDWQAIRDKRNLSSANSSATSSQT